MQTCVVALLLLAVAGARPNNPCGQTYCGLPALLAPLPDSARPRDEAAYVFSVSGGCEAKFQLATLAAMGLLLRTRPAYPVVAMLDGACIHDAAFASAVRRTGARLLRLPRLNTGCNGRRYEPVAYGGARKLNASEGRDKRNYYDGTYAKLRAWGLTQYRAVLNLDSDMAVLTSLDALLDTMVARYDEIRELRTPQGCLPQKDAHTYINTGVWGLRPNASVMAGLEHSLRPPPGVHTPRCIPTRVAARALPPPSALRRPPVRASMTTLRHVDFALCAAGHGHFACGVGDQTAAMQHFKEDHRLNKAGQLNSQMFSLHAGYNIKANIGAVSCLRKLQGLRVGPGGDTLNDLEKNGQHSGSAAVTALDEDGGGSTAADGKLAALRAHAHVVHWSGTRKPATISAGSVRDPIELRALAAYMREYRAAERLLQQAHADAQAERARTRPPWDRA